MPCVFRLYRTSLNIMNCFQKLNPSNLQDSSQSDKSILNSKKFRTLYKFTSWILPTKKLRLNYKNICSNLDLNKDFFIVQKNYKKIIERINSQNRKIRVAFLIRENQKWTYQSLYDEFAKSSDFEPLVLVSILTLAAKGKDKTRNNLLENYIFFKEKGMNVDFAYKDGEYIDLNTFKPDIIFYDQPWDLPEIHAPCYVSNFALTCYSPYGYELLEKENAYTQEFHHFLYKFFIEHEDNMKRYASYNKSNINNCVLTGYPKMDMFLEKQNVSCNLWRDNDKFKIIYAPHHSFEKKDIQLATFCKNGKFILELAKKHPETTWIFKPHPRFKYALLRNKIMNEAKIDDYYAEWSKIGCVYNGGNNFSLMTTSDLMITDCCSYLAEYVPTLKPLIRLINSKSCKLNEIGQRIMRGYYSVNNIDELESIFNELVTYKNDNKKIERQAIKNKLFDSNETSAHKIYSYLLNNIICKEKVA